MGCIFYDDVGHFSKEPYDMKPKGSLRTYPRPPQDLPKGQSPLDDRKPIQRHKKKFFEIRKIRIPERKSPKVADSLEL